MFVHAFYEKITPIEPPSICTNREIQTSQLCNKQVTGLLNAQNNLLIIFSTSRTNNHNARVKPPTS